MSIVGEICFIESILMSFKICKIRIAVVRNINFTVIGIKNSYKKSFDRPYR